MPQFYLVTYLFPRKNHFPKICNEAHSTLNVTNSHSTLLSEAYSKFQILQAFLAYTVKRAIVVAEADVRCSDEAHDDCVLLDDYLRLKDE